MMTTDDAWKLMNAYGTGITWTAEHVTAVRLLIDEDLDHFERVWSGKGNSWACIHDLIEALIRTREVSEWLT